MDKVIKCEKQSDHILLTFEDGTSDKLSSKKLIEMALIAKDPSLEFCKEVFDDIGAVMLPARDGREYKGYILFMNTHKATIQEIIRLHYSFTGETLLPPQVAGKLWKADKKAQVRFNLAVKWVNAYNNTDLTWDNFEVDTS